MTEDHMMSSGAWIRQQTMSLRGHDVCTGDEEKKKKLVMADQEKELWLCHRQYSPNTNWFWIMYLHKLYCTVMNLNHLYIMQIYIYTRVDRHILSYCPNHSMKYGFGVCCYFAVDLRRTYIVPECGQCLCLRTAPFPLHSQQPNELCMMCTAWARW